MSPVTWIRVEAGKKVRGLTYAGVERALGWEPGSCARFLATGQEPEAEAHSEGSHRAWPGANVKTGPLTDWSVDELLAEVGRRYAAVQTEIRRRDREEEEAGSLNLVDEKTLDAASTPIHLDELTAGKLRETLHTGPREDVARIVAEVFPGVRAEIDAAGDPDGLTAADLAQAAADIAEVKEAQRQSNPRKSRRH